MQELLRGTPPDVKHPITRRTPLGTLGAILSKARDPLSTAPNSFQNSANASGAEATRASFSRENMDNAMPPSREGELSSGTMSHFLRWVTSSSWVQNVDAALLCVSNSIGSIRGTTSNQEISAYSDEDQRTEAATLAALRVTRLLLAFGADPNQG